MTNKWQAHWIGDAIVGSPFSSPPPPMLRRIFSLPTAVEQATLHITALGVFEAELNGIRVSADELAPGWTEFSKRVPFHVYDVSQQLERGVNCLGVRLGDGWGCGHIEWRGRQRYGDRPLLLARLDIRCADGSEHVILTDETWRVATAEITQSDLLMGEHIDARLAQPGWSTAGYDDSTWRSCTVCAGPAGELRPRLGPPVRCIEKRSPVAEPQEQAVKQGMRWLFDVGENITGAIRLRVRGTRGTTLTVRYAEVLDEAGEPYYANLRTAEATDRFTLAGDGEETFATRFTFHGFRYVEVVCKRYAPDMRIESLTSDDLQVRVLASECDVIGHFSCNNDLVNQLQRNILRSQIGNFLEVPTDCPQRDERLGWTGDAQIFARTAIANMDCVAFFEKYLADLRDAQLPDGGIPPVAPHTTGVKANGTGPVWADAAIALPWTCYLASGEHRILRDNYGMMQAYMALQERTHADHIRPNEGFWTPGDWLHLDDETPREVIGTAWFAHTAGLMARMARVLEKADDAAHYGGLRETIVAAYRREFIDPNGQMVPRSQTAAVLTLAFDLAAESQRRGIADALAKDIEARGCHTSCGFVGSAFLLPVLSDHGHHDLACRLLAQTDYPSWLYPVTQGATSIWERWDGWTPERGFQDPAMNSFNHYAYGAVGEWCYRYLAGFDLDPDEPGYRHILLRPRPGPGFTRAAYRVDSPRGPAGIAWQLGDDTLAIDITVPDASRATLRLPAVSRQQVIVNAAMVEQAPAAELVADGPDHLDLALTTGTHALSLPWPGAT